MRARAVVMLGLMLLGSNVVRAGAAETRVTVVYDDVATEIAGARVDGAKLWVTTEGLTRATRFELKPQGVCRDELCFPLPKERRGEFVREEGGTRWFQLTEFARLVRQPFAVENLAGQRQDPGSKTEPGAPKENSVWYFGLRGDQREGLASLKAPNFTLPDMAGKMHSLADFAASGSKHGKKVLLVTWASW